MQDQQRQLPTLLPSLVLSGTMASASLVEMVQLIESNIIKILFLSPEKVFSPLFKQLLRTTTLAKQIRLVVVDEAHCISSWSYNFRSDYLRLYRVITSIRENSLTHCSLLALTATGGNFIRQDICQQLCIQPNHVMDCGWRRKEVIMSGVIGSRPEFCLQYVIMMIFING